MIIINIKNSNAVVLSLDEYNSLIETVYLSLLANYVDEVKELSEEPNNKY